MYKLIDNIRELNIACANGGYHFSQQAEMTHMGEVILLVCWDSKGQQLVAKATSCVGLQNRFQWNLGMFEAERVFGKQEDS